MPTLYLLDTNTVSDLIKSRSVIARETAIRARQTARLAISTVSEAELLWGVRKKPEATNLRAKLLDFFDSVEILPWDSAAAEAYSVLRERLYAQRVTLATLDLMIASHASSIGAVLVTRDKDFACLGNHIQTVNWSTDLRRTL